MSQATQKPNFLTPPEVARFFGVAPDKVLHWVKTGQLVAVNLAHDADSERARWRISIAEVEKFAESRKSKKPAPVKRRRRASTVPAREFF